jgi:hypothetical protein
MIEVAILLVLVLLVVWLIAPAITILRWVLAGILVLVIINVVLFGLPFVFGTAG